MDKVLELTDKKNAFFIDPGAEFNLFLDNTNEDIREINRLIARYNTKTTLLEKKYVLNEIEGEYKYILNAYPAGCLACSADFSEQILDKLFFAIQKERAILGLHSKHVNNSLASIIENMTPDKVNHLMSILNKGSLFNPNEFNNLYSSTDSIDDYNQFQAFLSTITEIKFLHEGNSKNFKITYPNGDALILKLEYRLDQPAWIEEYMQSGVLKNVMTPTYVRRHGTFTHKNHKAINVPINRALVVTDFCQGGDLEYHGTQQPNATAKIESALAIYTQMGNILSNLTHNGYAFPDMKNTNWLIDDKGLLKIADTKSFVHINSNGNLDMSIDENAWSWLPQTSYVSPFELIQMSQQPENDRYSADKMHVYMLGKNLYQYLSGCSYIDLYNNNFLFTSDVFRTDEGKKLESLIKSMVQLLPDNRISTAVALEKFKEIQDSLSQKAAAAQKALEIQKAKDEALRLTIQTTKNNCNALLDELLTFSIGNNDLKMTSFVANQRIQINHANNITVLNTLHDHLNAVLAMNKNSGIQQLKQHLTSLRNSPLYYLDIMNKHRKIEDALLHIPIEERGNLQKLNGQRSILIKNLHCTLNTNCNSKWLKTFYMPHEHEHAEQLDMPFKQKYNKIIHEEEVLNPMIKKPNKK